jgi:hypothetical protein
MIFIYIHSSVSVFIAGPLQSLLLFNLNTQPAVTNPCVSSFEIHRLAHSEMLLRCIAPSREARRVSFYHSLQILKFNTLTRSPLHNYSTARAASASGGIVTAPPKDHDGNLLPLAVTVEAVAGVSVY